MGEKNELTLTQKVCWALGQATGRQFVTALVSTYILVFLTDTFGIAAGAAGLIMSGAAIWDAINDPMIGSFADRTKTKWGTYRPFLLFVPLPWSIVSVLLFAAPNLTASGKIVYAAVLYICYGMLLTALEVPYYALLPAMTKNEMEKNDTISAATFVASIMILIVSSYTLDLVEVLGGGNASRGYMLTVGLGAALTCVTSWLAFLKCKERHLVEVKHEPILKGLTSLFKIREMYPMLVFWCVGCVLFQIIMASSVYYCMYYLMNPGLISTYMLIISISGMVGVMGLMPILLRIWRGSMKKTVTYTQSVAVVCYAICFFVGGKSLPALYVLTAIACVFSTMTNAFRLMTVVGMTEYTFLSSGQQMNGTISAIGGFSYKCGTAISNALLAGVLAVTGYIAGAIGEEPEAVLVGLNCVRFLAPLVASILYIICIQFYPEEQMRKLKEKS